MCGAGGLDNLLSGSRSDERHQNEPGQPICDRCLSDLLRLRRPDNTFYSSRSS
jgi:hypothetical protein